MFNHIITITLPIVEMMFWGKARVHLSHPSYQKDFNVKVDLFELIQQRDSGTSGLKEDNV